MKVLERYLTEDGREIYTELRFIDSFPFIFEEIFYKAVEGLKDFLRKRDKLKEKLSIEFKVK